MKEKLHSFNWMKIGKCIKCVLKNQYCIIKEEVFNTRSRNEISTGISLCPEFIAFNSADWFAGSLPWFSFTVQRGL